MKDGFELIDRGWDKVFHEAAAMKCDALRVMCPFIKLPSARRLIATNCPGLIRVLTRFNPSEMCDGVQDIDALRLLLKSGAKIRGVKGLHSKLYLFGNERAIVTSANLTEAALLRNHEFGFVSSRQEIIDRCHGYFSDLWSRAGNDLDSATLDRWASQIAQVRVGGARPSTNKGLHDEGVDVGFTDVEPVIETAFSAVPEQAFVKFFGETRTTRSSDIKDEVERTGCHWACTYPKRPRQVKDGATIFIGRMVENPEDTIVYGRAIAMSHQDARDEASQAEINVRPFKGRWRYYIRVHHAEFLAGTLANGVSLKKLMDDLKSETLASTSRNARAGGGNLLPSMAVRQQPAAELTPLAWETLTNRLEAAFERHGKLSKAELEQMDWPAVSPLVPAHLPEFVDWWTKHRGKANTGELYAGFLTRCAEHYGETINEQVVKTHAQADSIVARVAVVVRAHGRTERGTFNTDDLADNLTPALRAYADFNHANFGA